MSNTAHPVPPRHGSCALRLLLRAGIVLGVVVAVLQAIVLGSLLPDPILAGFAWSGRAGGWTSAHRFLTTYLIVIVSSAAMFLAVTPVLRISTRSERSVAPDPHRAERLASFEQWTLFLGLVTTTFAVAIVQYVAAANLNRVPRVDATVPVFVATYVVVAATWAVQMVRRFRPRPTPMPATVSA